MSDRRGQLKKLLNDPATAVDEMVEAFTTAHADIVKLAEPRVIARARTANSKVGLATGGGSGHEPAFLGYVGEGMADSAAIGNVFAAPSADVVLGSIRAANHGNGVILVYGNYTGDLLSCRLAMQRAEAEGIDVRAVFVSDDVASATADDARSRRGIAGGTIVLKATGAAAEAALTLDEVERVALKANGNTRSMGVALTSAELPGASKPIFDSNPDEMDVGLGVHGEPGISREPLLTADETGRLLADRVASDLVCPAGSRVALLVNGLGATPLVEQYLVYRATHAAIVGRGLTVERSYVGEYITSLQMSGVSVTITLLDDELLSFLDAPARTVSLVR